MMSFGQKIKDARKAKNMTQKELAKMIGAAHNSISDWENDKNRPDPDTIELLCGVLDISPNYLLAISNPDETSPAEKLMLKKFRTLDAHGKRVVSFILDEEYDRALQAKEPIEYGVITRIPYAGKIAAAGKGVYLDDIPMENITVHGDIPDADFVIGVTGNSMEPTYHDGDRVFIKRQEELETGEIGLFRLGSELFIKQLEHDGLHSHNPEYTVIPASSEIIVVGKVVGKVENENRS